MSKFLVEVPVVMKMFVSVEADTEEEAIEKVFDSVVRIDINCDHDK